MEIERTNVLDALTKHHLVEDLPARHAYEGMIHCGRAVWFQWLDVAVVLTIEGRRGP